MNDQSTQLKNQAFEAYQKKDFKSAEKFFSEACLLLHDQQQYLDEAEMRNNLCVVLLELKKPEKALDAVISTEQIFATHGDKKRQAMALGNIATCLQALNNLEEALLKFEESSILFKEIGEKELRSITLKKISDLQLRTGKQFQAMASLDAAYDQKQKKTVKDKVLKGFLANLIQKITRRA